MPGIARRVAHLVRGLAALAALCAAPALAQPYAFITHIALGATPGSLTVVDVRTQAIVGQISFGGTLEAVAAETSGRYVWIGDRLGDVYKIDVATRTVAAGPIDVGHSNLPRGIAVDPAGTFVYVANMDSGTVAVIDTSTNTVLSPQIAVGTSPHGIAVDPTGTWVYVTNEADDTVTVISTATKSVVATVAVGADPIGVAFNPSGTRAYVANNIDDTITVINPAGPHTVLGSPIAVPGGPFGLAISSDGKRLYASNCCADTVTEINIQGDANVITDTVPVDLGPEGISIEPLGRYVLAVNVDGGSLSIIDTSVSPKTVTTLPMGPLLNSTFGMFITPGPPGAPTAASAAAGNAQATVTFTPPVLDGGQPITGYTVTSNPAGGVDAGAGTTSTSHVVTGLANGTSYTFTVTATNSMGTGDPSAPSNAVTPVTVPGAPTAVAATAGNAQATVTFAAPASDGGSPVTGYRVASNPAGGVDANAGATGLSHLVTGLTNGTPYTFTVTATNAAGTGGPSIASNTVTPSAPPGVPGAPTAVVATPGNASATVSFTPPASNGGSPITGYAVTSSPAGGVDANAGTTATTHTIGGLANGTAYTFSVTATNAIGTGPPSAASNSVTPSAPPVRTFSAASATGSGTITASFTGGGAACTFVAPRFIGPPPGASPIPPTPPGLGIVFPQGLFDFTASGCTVGGTLTFTIVYPQSIAGATYWKYGPTASDPSPHWYVLPAAITGNTASFTIVDGGLGDDDLAANGTIVDQGGPGLAPQSVPALSQWMLVLLGLAMLAWFHLQRPRR